VASEVKNHLTPVPGPKTDAARPKAAVRSVGGPRRNFADELSHSSLPPAASKRSLVKDAKTPVAKHADPAPTRDSRTEGGSPSRRTSSGDEHATRSAEPKSEPSHGAAPVKDDHASRTAAKKTKAARDDDKGDDVAKADGRAETKDDKDPAAKKKALQPLHKAAQASRKEIQNAPAVALLTGHIEKLKPDQIPTLVSGNRFVTDALGEADANAFMTKPVAVADLIQNLGLPPQVASMAAQMGFDLSQMVTPNEFLKTIGIDPTRVAAELTLLKSNLAAQGVAAYVQRAQALAGKEPLGSGLPAGGKLGADLTKQGLHQMPGTLLQSQVPTQPSLPVLSTGGALKQGMQASGVDAQALLGKDDKNETGDTKRLPADLALALAQGGLALNTAENPSKSAGQGAPQQAASAAATATATALADTSLRPQAASAPASAPSMHRATYDAFTTLGERLKGVDTQSIGLPNDKAAAPQTGRSLVEHLASQSVKALSAPPVPAALTAQPQLPLDPQQSAGADPNSAQVASPAASTHAFIKAASAGTGSLAQSARPAGARPMQVDELRLAFAPAAALKGAAAKTGEGSTGKDDSQQRQDGERQRGGGLTTGHTAVPTSLATHQTTTHAPTHSFQAHVHGEAEVGLTPAQRVELVQRVIDRAALLAKGTGGVVRLDLGSPELGSLEMAVKMDDDRVDLRVMTGSDRVREAMMADISRLRDALAVQNVRLGQVEVGVSQKRQPDSFTSLAGGGSQNGRAFDQQQSGDSGRRRGEAPRVPRLNGVQEVAGIQAPLADTVLENLGLGRIAVRV